MHLLRRFSLFGLALLLFAGVSCTSTDTLTEAPVAEEQLSPEFGLVGDLLGGVGDLAKSTVITVGNVTDLLTCSTENYERVSKTVGPKGGTIRIGRHRLEIPRGALSTEVRITAEQVPGNTNSLRFSPEGLEFENPAVLTMSYENCAVVLFKKKIAYTDENLKILEVFRSLDLFKKKTVSAPIDHFSRYVIAY